MRERDDIVALDSSIILHPQVWHASGHVEGFSDPLVDCRTCKQRFRADHLDQAQCGKRPSKRPGETPDCDLTEPRHFNLMFQTRVGAGRGDRRRRLPAPGDRAGDLHQLQERRPDRAAQAALRDRADRQGLSQRDHARKLHLPHARVRADGDGVLRAAGRGGRVVPLLGRRALPLAPPLRRPREPSARAAARAPTSSRITRAARATSSTSSRSAGRSSRGSRTAAPST